MRFVLLALALSACAIPTPYQPQGELGGYTDFPVPGQRGVHYVRFGGNGYTDRTTVIRYWHQRASEICPGGYAIQNSDVDTQEVSQQITPGRSNTTCTGGGVVPVTCNSTRSPGLTSTYDRSAMEGYIRCNTSEPYAQEEIGDTSTPEAATTAYWRLHDALAEDDPRFGILRQCALDATANAVRDNASALACYQKALRDAEKP